MQTLLQSSPYLHSKPNTKAGTKKSITSIASPKLNRFMRMQGHWSAHCLWWKRSRRWFPTLQSSQLHAWSPLKSSQWDGFSCLSASGIRDCHEHVQCRKSNLFTALAEIGDVTRLKSEKSLIALTGIDPPPNHSGKDDPKSRSISKRGSPALRKILFLIMTLYLQRQPVDEPVYQFLDKKRTEGKPYKVYMIAAAHKFLRIYYARIKEAMPVQ